MKGNTRYFATYHSPVGKLSITCQDNALTGICLAGQKYFAADLIAKSQQQENLPLFLQVKSWLDHYFSGKQPSINTLALTPQGTAFQHLVWTLLCEVPYGKLITYGEIATQIATIIKKPTMSSQAVGGAVSRNPISIIIPCHRVIGANGNLTGYAGGIENKIILLQTEGINIETLLMPKKYQDK